MRTRSVTAKRASRAPLAHGHCRRRADRVFHGLKAATRYPADYRERWLRDTQTALLIAATTAALALRQVDSSAGTETVENRP
jgi:hypothetical protein